jgi:hypothetical protein
MNGTNNIKVTFIHVAYAGKVNLYRTVKSPQRANWLPTVCDVEELVSKYLETQN